MPPMIRYLVPVNSLALTLDRKRHSMRASSYDKRDNLLQRNRIVGERFGDVLVMIDDLAAVMHAFKIWKMLGPKTNFTA